MLPKHYKMSDIVTVEIIDNNYAEIYTRKPNSNEYVKTISRTDISEYCTACGGELVDGKCTSEECDGTNSIYSEKVVASLIYFFLDDGLIIRINGTDSFRVVKNDVEED